MKTLSVRKVPDELWMKCKILALEAGTTLEKWIIEAMLEKAEKKEEEK